MYKFDSGQTVDKKVASTEDNSKKTSRYDHIPTATYYANTGIFSQDVLVKYSSKVGKLCKNVLDDK